MNKKIGLLSIVFILVLAAIGVSAMLRQTNELNNQQTNQQTNQLNNQHTNQQTDQQNNQETDHQTNQETDQQTNQETDHQTNQQTNQQTDPWTPAQLMEPADLAGKLKDIAANPPLIVCVGPSGIIKGSVETGPAHIASNLDSLKRLLMREDRQREVIIYCGCCPFKNCPNVRPAFSLLLSLGFKVPRLLDLPHNIKVDWIDKGYPVMASK